MKQTVVSDYAADFVLAMMVTSHDLLSSRMLKKHSLAFAASPLARRDSLVAHIFNRLQLSKNRVFQ